MEQIIEAYRKYKDSGIMCLPVKDKIPMSSGSWKEGITDESLYKKDIAIVCGKISGGIECVDFDNHFDDAKKLLSTFAKEDNVREVLSRYSIPVESTVSGGFHLIYRCKTIEGNLKLASRPKVNDNGQRVRDVLIETRGEGGYFVSAPSEGYSVLYNNIYDIPVISAEDRDTLLNTARSLNEWVDNIHGLRNEPEVTKREDVGPADYFNDLPEAIDEVKSCLLRHGWDEVQHGRWRRPDPRRKRSFAATLGYAGTKIFFVFSDAAYPFELEQGYSPFGVIGMLDYGGDYSKFASYIVEKYNLKSQYTKSEKRITKEESVSMLESSRIDLNIPKIKPPEIIRIRDHMMSGARDNRLFTLGNFSCITGKSKSKKTFLGSLIMASAVGNFIVQDKFIADMPENKKLVLLFDTEQSEYDAYVSASRINRILGTDRTPSTFYAFDLREYSPLERCDIIEQAFEKYGKSIGYVMIDGIADLAKAINDEEEASRVVSLMMKWTKIYNCHITTIIHQNKNDNYATGHLGSSVMKKSECVISVSKDQDDYTSSKVSCELIRGTSDFEDFNITISSDGLPSVDTTAVQTRGNAPF